MKKYLPIIFVFFSLPIHSLPVNSKNSQEQAQVEDQIAALQDIVEGLDKFQEESEKIFKKLEPAQKRVTFDNKVLSFETLDQVRNYADLPNYGLVAPEQYNHRSGSNLVLLAIASTSIFKGPWVMAHGLLGTNMLDVNVHDRTGYQSLFLSLTQDYKMYASYLFDDGALLTEIFEEPSKSLTSIIAKREAYIFLVSWELNERYIYTADGTFGRIYLPERGRKSNKQLKQHLIDGLKVYHQLNEMGFDDKTLKDTLGMAYASLDYDGVYLSHTDTRGLGVLQVYSDALTATLTELKKEPNHSYEFLEELGLQMQVRRLSTYDEILTPSNNENYQAILRIVRADLEKIRQIQINQTSDVSNTRTEEEIVFKGIPQIRIRYQGTPEKLTQEQSIEYKCTITKIDNNYFWSTRENVELIRIQSGIYTTFVATNGSGYVRVIDPEMKKAVSKEDEQVYDYVEHLLLGLSTISYYGMLR